MEYNLSCEKILKELSGNYKLISLVSDAVYNHDRYAYNSNIFIMELNPPCKKTCKKVKSFIRQTDKYLQLDDRFCVIEYPFIEFSDAQKAFDNLKNHLFEQEGLTIRYALVSLEDEDGFNAADIIKKISENICKTDFEKRD